VHEAVDQDEEVHYYVDQIAPELINITGGIILIVILLLGDMVCCRIAGHVDPLIVQVHANVVEVNGHPKQGQNDTQDHVDSHLNCVVEFIPGVREVFDPLVDISYQFEEALDDVCDGVDDRIYKVHNGTDELIRPVEYRAKEANDALDYAIDRVSPEETTWILRMLVNNHLQRGY